MLIFWIFLYYKKTKNDKQKEKKKVYNYVRISSYKYRNAFSIMFGISYWNDVRVLR